ncbi:hypothetical protein BDW22DRAFT_1358063 [Trametopsis cervina]|nr:hypothetical protein BDW22DRAFT_1358063 [Trametopsis cervina]
MAQIAPPPPFSGVAASIPDNATASTTTLDAKKKPAVKRKRTGDGASDSAESSSQTPRTRDGPKKKKANRACFHCQKAHLTCDDSRPCQRCVKRGMADNCTEGHRKKAKYLLDEEELEALKRSKSGEAPAKSTEAPTSQQPMFTYNTTASYGFAPSEAANIEYSILSTILGNSSESSAASPSNPSTGSAQPQHSSTYPTQQSPPVLVNASWPASSSGFSPQAPLAIQPSETTLPGSSSSATTSGYPSQYSAGTPTFSPTTNGSTPAQGPYADFNNQPPSSSLANYAGQAAPATLAPATVGVVSSQPARSSSTSLIDRTVSTGTASWVGPSSSDMGTLDGTSVYKSVTSPYDYTQGYHFLMKHLPTRGFEKNDILRIVRALAIFRPSLIALQMPMSEEDEVFIERCFQRSLVELEKLVSFSGTPTLAWRRTGEICLVGPEFCMLTGWEREELIGRKKYIYELFENQSVVEYWENFANHAFENTTQSVYSHCVILKPSGAPVPCTFCFSIRRDIMDLPSLVIGQWLPLL